MWLGLLCDNVWRFGDLGVCLAGFWDFAGVCCSDFVCCLFRFWFVCFGCFVFCLWFVILVVWIVFGFGFDCCTLLCYFDWVMVFVIVR